ncbi:transposable element Tcb1 transposase [Trichonephila clavipes]|nr:transposable element Tcb1 transposase [Trichonephila clavipes]
MNKKSTQKVWIIEEVPVAEEPFEMISLDTVGGFNYHNSQKKYLHIVLWIMLPDMLGHFHPKRLLKLGLRAKIPLYRIPLTQNHRHLRLQWANVHRSWHADWQQVVFSDESRCNWLHHDGRIGFRRYAGERHIPECNIERHTGRTPGVMVWGAIAYHGRSQLLRK